MNRFEFLKKIKLPKIKTGRVSAGQIIFWTLTIFLAIGAFIFTRGLTACWDITGLEGYRPASCAGASENPLGTPVVNEQGTEIAPADLPPTPAILPPDALPPAWDGASRINILFIGLDYRDWIANEGPPRSDTMILFTIDPITKTAGMLSIPRDMWVNIPGFGYSRINTAYSSGEGNQLPGGGPGLAMKTVEQFIGVPVHYYVQVDFGTFVEFIDYLGGLRVYVDQDLILDLVGPGYDPIGYLQPNDTVKILGKTKSERFLQIEFPSGPDGKGWIVASAVEAQGLDTLPIVSNDNGGLAAGSGLTATIKRRVDIRAEPGNPNHVKVTCCGYRHMNGANALAYARTRKTEGGDVDRAHRQQQVIFALQKKIFDPTVFPGLVLQAPAIYQQFSSGIHTNMPLEDAIKLAVLGKDISSESIKSRVIDNSMVTFDNTVLGGQNASVLKPIADKIRVLRDEIFTSSGALSPQAAGDPVSLMRAEEARIRVVDGTFSGLEQRAGAYFQGQGLNVTEVGPANDVYGQTVVVVYGPKVYTLRYLVATYGLANNQIRFSPDPAQTVDIEIRVGSDLAGSIP
jgi:anionic cell wall polymer biosynthesis LytR-Cps2A-Psr (LCP) family protein